MQVTAVFAGLSWEKSPRNILGISLFGLSYFFQNGGRSSVGRAPDCDSGGRGFDPHRPPQFASFP